MTQKVDFHVSYSQHIGNQPWRMFFFPVPSSTWCAAEATWLPASPGAQWMATRYPKVVRCVALEPEPAGFKLIERGRAGLTIVIRRARGLNALIICSMLNRRNRELVKRVSCVVHERREADCEGLHLINSCDP